MVLRARSLPQGAHNVFPNRFDEMRCPARGEDLAASELESVAAGSALHAAIPAPAHAGPLGHWVTPPSVSRVQVSP